MHPDFTPRGRRWGNRLLIPCEHCGDHFLVPPSKADRRFCSWAHYVAARMVDLRIRLRDKTDRSGPVVRSDLGRCWIFTGTHVDGGGYGLLTNLDWPRTKPHYLKAHRIAWELAYGPIPAGAVVRHKCDTARCVRPDHLELGTQADNVQDMWDRRRRSRDGIGPKRPGGYKLTDAQAAEIRRRYTGGGISQSALAAEYGVDQGQISRIVNRKAFMHLL